MNKLTILTILIFGLFACNKKTADSSSDLTVFPDAETENLKYNTINLQFDNPIILDSSDWVLYPLTLEELEEAENGFRSGSYGRQYAYWNIAFYNTETKETRLLSDNLKMLINSISPKNNNTTIQPGQRNNKNERLIYYSITKTDYNQDKKLNSYDPKYLFVSDLSGQNFKQVSPDNSDLIHWEKIDRTNKILIQVRNDSNNDKKFDYDDEIVSFVYDIEGQKIEQVFCYDFNLKIKKMLDNQWIKKK